MSSTRVVSLHHPRIGGVKAHVHYYYPTLVGHAAVSSHLPFVCTLYFHRTGHTKFYRLLHRVYRPVGARPFNAADAAICASDAERALVVTAGKTVTTESA